VRRRLLRLAPFPDELAFQLVAADDFAAAVELVLRARPAGAVNVAAPPVIDRAAYAEIFGGVGPSMPVAAIRALAATAWHARLIPTEPGWLDMAAQVPCMDTGRLEALGWTPANDARDVLGGFVDALRRGDGHPGPLLQPSTRRRRPAR
jgi:nucleoside-diphosphate-sugar epimerase